MPPLSKDAITWDYRLFLDCEREKKAVPNGTFACAASLHEVFLGSLEYRLKNPGNRLNLAKWVLQETIHGFQIWVSLGELGITRPILSDLYENREASTVKRFVHPGDTVLDIGTNIGFYSLLFASLVGPTGKVIGFESLSSLCKMAQRSINENNLSHFCTVHNAAGADQTGVPSIRHTPRTTSFRGGISPRTAHPRRIISTKGFMFCASTTISHPPVFLSSRSAWEARSLWRWAARGGYSNATVQSFSPSFIINNYVSSADELIRQMSLRGYNCYRLADEDLRNPIFSYDAVESINVLFIPIKQARD